MAEFLVHPVVAFLLYIGLIGILMWIGRVMAANGSPRETSKDQSVYAGGESIPPQLDASGYGAFTQIALFFAVLHLGILILATGGQTLITAAYLGGLVLILMVLLLRTKGRMSS